VAVQTRSESTVATVPPYRWFEGGGSDRLLDRLAYRRVHAWKALLAKRGLQVEIIREAAGTVVRLEGRLDGQSAPVLKEGFQEVMSMGSSFIEVDLGGVSRIDGVGLAALVWAWRLAQEVGGHLRLARLQPQIREIAARIGLNSLLEITEKEPLVTP